MRRLLCVLISLLLILPGCSTSAPPSESSSETKENTINTSWHEIGEGPSGWVIGILVENNTADQFTQDAIITITDTNGELLGEDIIHIDVAPNDYHDYPVHCKVGNSYNVDIKDAETTPVHDSSHEAPTSHDDRGIPGMGSFALLTVLSGDPFEIPAGEFTPTETENTTCAFTCTSSGGGEGTGVMYDYSLTLDADEEIIGASFGIASTTASEQELLTAADLYFYAVSLLKYDTANTEALTSWFAENLSEANSEAIEITLGDAHFQLYGIPGTMYWVDISKI